MIGFRFAEHNPDADKSKFDQLFDLFKQLMLYSNGDVNEALAWLNQLDNEYKLTTPEYGMADFIDELRERGYINNPQGGDGDGRPRPTKKLDGEIRRSALEEIFGKIKKTRSGQHTSAFGGLGDEHTSDLRPFSFGDSLDQVAISESLKNAYINNGIEDFSMTQDDLEVRETYQQSQTSTVLMIDISHSMILYGEDRITPAKKVALALAELIRTKYPKDTLDIIVFGDDAWQIELKDLANLEVGPFHTNTVAGLELAMELLRKRKNPNKQIFMITDGKPSCIKRGKQYYKNSFGLDRQIVNRCLTAAQRCKKLEIPITTFMIAQDPYLVQFVEQFTKTNGGKAFYSGLQGLGEFVFADYKSNKRRRMR